MTNLPGMTATARPVTLDRLTRADLPRAVALHAQLLPHGFFVGLGARFMRRYYRGFVDSPHAHAACVRADGRVVGVLVGVLDHEQHLRWTMRQLPALAAAGGVSLVVRPHMVRRFLRTRVGRYSRAVARRLRGRAPWGRSDRAQPVIAPAAVAVLSHVYVDPSLQGGGLGGLLVEDFLAAARRTGAARAELVTLADGDGAGAFYLARGWQRSGHHWNADGRPFETYARTL